MTDEELKELFEPGRRELEARFHEINRRFDQVDVRFERVDSRFGDLKRHVEVVDEATRSEVRQVAEGLELLNQKTDREFAKVWVEFDDVKAMIKFSAADAYRQITDLKIEQLEVAVFGRE